MRRGSIFLLLCVSAALQVSAQGIDVRGIVADSATGERLPHANIIIRGLNRGASTNVNGFFLITNVPFGAYEIVASAVGFQRGVKRIAVRGREPIVLNFRLSQRDVEVPEVIVEAERVPEKLDAASVHVLGPEEIQHIPSAGQGDLFRSLLILPGIVSTSDVSSKFYVRGGAGDQNLILLDGMRMHNPYHAFGIFSVFDPDLISTTEVYTGAFPAGYGNRLSSVVNMTTKQGNSKRFAGKAEVNFLNGKLQLEGPIQAGNSWLINGRMSLFDGPFKHFLRNPAPISFYDLFFKGTIGNESGRNSLRGFFTGDRVSSGNPDEPDHSWTNHAISASLAGLTSDRIYVEGVVYTSIFEIRRDAKESSVVRSANSRIGDDGIRVDVTIHTESRGMFMTGFQFDLPEYEFTYSTPSNAERTYTSLAPEVSIWFRHQREFGAIHADVGLHVDVVSVFDRGVGLQALQPRLSVSYELSDLWQTRFSFGVYNQRVITISNEDDITSLFEAWTAIPEELEPEEAHHYVFGLEGLFSSQLSIGFESYYKNYPSIVLYNREKFLPTDPDYLNGTGKAYGAELLTRFGSPFVDLYLAYSLGWTTVTAGGFTYSPRYDRRHTINALGVVHPIENLDVSLRWEFGSGYPFTQTIGYYDRLLFGNIGGGALNGETGSPYSILGEKNAARLPAYYRIDAGITYHFSYPPIRGSVGLNFANLTNRKNILFYDRKSGQRINMLDFFPSATLKVEY